MNRVMLMGNIGAEPEVRTLQNGNVVASARLATTKKGYTTANGTKVEDVTYWHSLILWGKKAELMRDYVHKGDRLCIEGELQYRKYTNKQGAEVEVTEINVMEMWFASRKGNGQQAAQGHAPAPAPAPQVHAPAPQGPQFAPPGAPAPAPNNYQAAPPQAPPTPSYAQTQTNGWGGNGGGDEDLPF